MRPILLIVTIALFPGCFWTQPQMTTYTDDFNRANEALGASANWTQIESSLSIVSNEVSGPAIGNNGVARFEQVLGSADQEASVTVTNHGGADANAGPCVRFDGSNCYVFVVRNSNTNTYRLFQYAGASSFTLLGSAVSATKPAVPFTATLTITGSTLSGKIGGVEVISHALVSDTLSANRKSGIYASNAPTLDDFSVTSEEVVTSLSITTPQVNQIIQRTGTTFAGGTAGIAISGTYEGTPAAIEASFNGGSYATIDASPAGGTFSGTLSGQAAGQGTLTVRFTDDVSTSGTVADVGIGEVFAAFGQSNAVCLATNPQTWSAPTGYSHYKPGACKFSSTSWATLADHPFNVTEEPAASGKGSCYPLLAELLMEELGVPVGFICVGKGTTGLIGGAEVTKLNHWDKDGTGTNAADQYDKAVATVNANQINDCRAILWYQGEADCKGSGSGNNAGRVAYAAAITQLLDDLQADCTALSDSKMVVATLAEYVRADVSTQDLTDIRLAQFDAVAADADLYIGPVGYEQNFADDSHWTTDAQISALARRWFASINTALFSGTEGRGPRLSSAVENAARTTVTLTYDRDLNTSDTAYTASAFGVTDDGSAATISGVARSGARDVVVTLNTALTGTETLVSAGRGNLAAGATVPRSTAITFPDASTDTIPSEPFESQLVSAFVTTITVTSPTTNDVRLVGAAVAITWTSDGVAGTVDVLLSLDDGSSYPTTIASGETNDGTYSWTPTQSQVTATAKIKVVDSSDAAVFGASGSFKVATTTAGSGNWKPLARDLAIQAGYEVIG